MALPGEKVRQLIVSPSDELITMLKRLGHQETDKA
jgi:hypothetical protein